MEVWLTPELREPFETYSFLVPHSLTLPEYLAQFECKLDYYSLLFTMRSSSVASLFLVSFNDKAIMCRDLRRNVFFHREMENAPPPGRADGDDGDRGTRAAARGNADNGGPLRNDDAAATAIASEADDAGQKMDDHDGDDGDDNKDDDKWGRGS